jgi:hypothetical protein
VRIAAACVLALALSACGAADDEVATTVPTNPGEVEPTSTGDPDLVENGSTTPSPAIDRVDCPEVVAVEMTQTAPGVFKVTTTVRSTDIEGVSYADAWEVRDLDGAVYGERILTHPHVNEQPFTRSLSGVAIPIDVTRVEVAARDSVRGFCGAPLIFEVPHS